MSKRRERASPRSKDPQNYSRPNGAEGMPDQSRHAHKEPYDLEHGCSATSKAVSGTTAHSEKAAYDQAHGRSGLSKPSSGPTDRGKDPENMSKPHGGDEPIPKESHDRAKNKKKIEPKPGHTGGPAKYPDGSTTTKTSFEGE
jgi:hypothetical protein